MSDLIDRQAAIATAVRATIDWHRLANPQYSIAYCIGEAMRAIPAADVAEVVRCKECKHWTNNIGDSELRDNYCNEVAHGFYYRCSGDDYCSFAERRTNGRD